MDIAIIMFGSLISTMTALTFLEVRRIRKIMESKKELTAMESRKSGISAAEPGGR